MQADGPHPEFAPVVSAQRTQALGLLAHAFHDDPILRWCFLAGSPGYAERLRGYLEAGHDWHSALGQPVQGAYAAGRLVGVLYASLPEVEPASVDDLRSRMIAVCGAEGTDRFFRYTTAMDALAPEGPHHVIALLGVQDSARGLGIGDRLVRWAGALCDAHASSRGVVLDTGSDHNQRFYERRGYRVLRRQRFDGVTERLLLRPRGSGPAEDGA